MSGDDSRATGSGPLAGVRVLEIESIGPGPFAAMLLADLGASVLRVARPKAPNPRRPNPVLDRGRAGTVHLDLKSAPDHARAAALVGQADVLIEGFRPTVMERLRLGPDECHAYNPRLVYGRITGWGRIGPLAAAAGHDINYIGLSGALFACGTAESGPVPPLNLVGDFGGGGMLLALGLVSALFEARTSGRGQVVDAAMLEGSGILMAMIHGFKAMGTWNSPRAGNLLDGSAYFYRCYRCACGGWMAVGAIEPEFRRLFLSGLGLAAEADAIMRAAPADATIHARIAALFAAHPRQHWERVFEGGDACVSPVLPLEEAPMHPQNVAASAFHVWDGAVHPTPAPRFSRTTLPGPEAAAQLAGAKLAMWNL